MSKSNILHVAHSPDPDDAFMFYAISQKKIALNGYRIKHVLKDIQSLNQDARKGLHHVTAISAAAYPMVQDKYWILSVGASVGRKYGPKIVCRPERLKELRGKSWDRLKIATPGPLTTAYMLLRLFRKKFVTRHVAFDKIIDEVKQGRVDAGLIIHEGQITYKKWGLVEVADLGLWWHKKTGLPIPLGLDVVRKDMGRAKAVWMADVLYQSIRLAYKQKKAAVAYALKFGRGINAKIGERFVKMYVNKDTLDMGDEGEKSLKLLFDGAYRAGLLKNKVKFELIRPSAG